MKLNATDSLIQIRLTVSPRLQSLVQSRISAFVVVVLVFMLFAANPLNGQEFTGNQFASGTGALEIFDSSAAANAPLGLKLWLVLLLSTFASSLFFVRRHPIARWALGGILVAMLAGHSVFGALGLPMLSGSIAIWHLVCWTPVLALLLVHRPFLDPKEGRWFRIWSGLITFVILISFFFDLRDAGIYIYHIRDFQ